MGLWLRLIRKRKLFQELFLWGIQILLISHQVLQSALNLWLLLNQNAFVRLVVFIFGAFNWAFKLKFFSQRSESRFWELNLDTLRLQLSDRSNEGSYSFFVEHVDLSELILKIFLLVDPLFGLFFTQSLLHQISNLLVNLFSLSKDNLGVSVFSIFFHLSLFRVKVVVKTLLFFLRFNVSVKCWSFDRSDSSELAKLSGQIFLIHVWWEPLENDRSLLERFYLLIFECFALKKLILHPLSDDSTSDRLDPLLVGELHDGVSNLVPCQFILSSHCVE